jgi:NAD(P)-dependent dehydrogenase (short-subunit alcohol dehydrogenase family)
MTDKHILITGTSSGIGLATALHLAQLGYQVHAGVRSEEDAATLRNAGYPNLNPLILDVVQPKQIDAAISEITVRLNGNGLFALINNAGYNLNGPFEHHDQTSARALMDVNFFGLVNLSQAAIPLLRQYAKSTSRRAHLVNLGSIGSLIGFPWESFYHASKFAVFGLSESLRQELRPQHIAVSVVMPGGIRTPFIDKTVTSLKAAENTLPTEEAKHHYAASLRRMQNTAAMANRFGSKPEAVAKVIERILAARDPRFAHIVGPDAQMFRMLKRLLPDSLIHALWRSGFSA